MKSYDLVCVGSGPGGLTAALTAANKGKTVLLIERNEYLGGSLVTGANLVGPEMPPEGFPQTGALLQELVRKGAVGETSPWQGLSTRPVNPDLIRLAALQICEKVGMDFLFGTLPSEVHAENGVMKEMICLGKNKRMEIRARAFIDGTGRGSLLHLAGADREADPVQNLSLTGLLMCGEAGIPELFGEEAVHDLTEWVQCHTEIPAFRVYLQKALEPRRIVLQLIEQKDIGAGAAGQLNALAADFYHLFMRLREACPGFGQAQISRTSPCFSVSVDSGSVPAGTDWEDLWTPTSVKGLFACGQLVPVRRPDPIPFVPAVYCMMAGEAAGLAASAFIG